MQNLKLLVTHVNNPLLEIMKEAGLYYSLWWKLSGPERPKLVKTMNRYVLFFGTSINSYILALIISLYKLYDTNLETNNFNRLVNLVKKEGTFSKEEMTELDSKFNQAKNIWKKVAILRHNYFAHLNIKFDMKSLYKEASIKPDEFRKLITLSFDIFNLIRSHYREGELGLISTKRHVDDLFNHLDIGYTQSFKM